MTDIRFTVSYRGTPHSLTLPSETTYAALSQLLAQIPSIALPPSSQKLVVKGRSKFDPSETLSEMKLTEGAKTMLVGSQPADVEALRHATERAEANRTRDARAVRSTLKSSSTSSVSLHYTFHVLTPLPEFRDADRARGLLARLKDDPAIRTIMAQNAWSVGTLLELHPAERTILGYNRNAGESIALRLRTDKLDGFRHYPEVVKVMLHELAHMVHSPHDDKFHALDRKLNADYKRFTGRTIGEGGGRGGGPFGDGGAGSTEGLKAFDGGSYKLGGALGVGSQRELLAAAADRRLTREEEAMVQSCGSTLP
ncbi:hypothetical protein HKX48_006543 [Thoreauomyces humboldtii]|nr:hypothetical protein HKX48_006543 [Thoreauomyces humboldtii]